MLVHKLGDRTSIRYNPTIAGGMKNGQRSYIPGIGYIRITCVEAVKLADLTDADALPGGFPTADLLRREVRAVYKEKTQEHWKKRLTAYRICFVVYPPHI
ncbi:MAG: hypothetical protein LBT46_14870 [Planctomycetaceae bacterium]|jgi:hypothetical protein|nr:hypothetical protein [Planctomycetaceae bacterium]